MVDLGAFWRMLIVLSNIEGNGICGRTLSVTFRQRERKATRNRGAGVGPELCETSEAMYHHWARVTLENELSSGPRAFEHHDIVDSADLRFSLRTVRSPSQGAGVSPVHSETYSYGNGKPSSSDRSGRNRSRAATSGASYCPTPLRDAV